MGSYQVVWEAKRAIDLAAVVEAEGRELRPAGPGRLRGLCPFHPEKTPSFFIFTDQGRWRCFGCGEGGDAIDFVRKARSCSFRQALAVLGMDDPQRTVAELSRMRAERKRREALQWLERELAWSLAKAIRVCHSMIEQIAPENFDSPEFTLVFHQLPIIEYQHSVLTNGEPEDRAALVRELAGLSLLPRRLMFRRDFDYADWLRSTLKEPRKCNLKTDSP